MAKQGKVPGTPGGRLPRVAPFESCVSCFRGDTSTVVFVTGSAEFHIAALMRAAGLEQGEASATFRAMAQERFGTDPGKVPVGVIDGAFRLCGECAAKTGTTIVEKSRVDAGEPVPGYDESQMFPEGLGH